MTDVTKIATIGEILVEIMAEDLGRGFREPLRLVGPYPSGAPAIFIDQVAKLGHPCGIVSCVGGDDFGALCLDRLSADGVDVAAVAVRPDRVTGSAFVRYREDGDRDFIFNIARSACGETELTETGLALLDGCGHLHVMGSSLFFPNLIEVTKAGIERVKARRGTVSFDPNVRREMLSRPGMQDALTFMLRHCDIFLPSGPELTLLTDATTEEGAIAEALSLGPSCVVLKRGASGASYHDGERAFHLSGFAVDEVDPTGAGDCFGGAFVACRLQGKEVEESLRYACAAGARAVTRRGPMEGASTLAELDAFLAAM